MQKQNKIATEEKTIWNFSKIMLLRLKVTKNIPYPILYNAHFSIHSRIKTAMSLTGRSTQNKVKGLCL